MRHGGAPRIGAAQSQSGGGCCQREGRPARKIGAVARGASGHSAGLGSRCSVRRLLERQAAGIADRAERWSKSRGIARGRSALCRWDRAWHHRPLRRLRPTSTAPVSERAVDGHGGGWRRRSRRSLAQGRIGVSPGDEISAGPVRAIVLHTSPLVGAVGRRNGFGRHGQGAGERHERGAVRGWAGRDATATQPGLEETLAAALRLAAGAAQGRPVRLARRADAFSLQGSSSVSRRGWSSPRADGPQRAVWGDFRQSAGPAQIYVPVKPSLLPYKARDRRPEGFWYGLKIHGP